MLRAGVKDPIKPIIVCGLAEGNIERLKAGYPIDAALSTFGMENEGRLIIFYGKTNADMEEMFKKNGLISEGAEQSFDPQLDQHEEAARQHPHVLIALVGLPRSGKTTWARKQAYPIVCPDSIRLAIHGQRFYAPAEPIVWATAHLMVDSLFKAGHKHVVLDSTCTTRKRRDEWLSKGHGLFFHEITTSADVCMRRAEEAKDEDILPVIGRMANQYEPLGKDELRW